MSDPVKRKCPECGNLKLKRLIGTGAGVLFKGGGFYQTDYRSDSYKKGADAEKKASESKSPEKSEKKSTTKSESKSTDSGGSKSSDSKGKSKS